MFIQLAFFLSVRKLIRGEMRTALFSVPRQLIGFANGGDGEVALILLCVFVIAGVIYVKDCCVYIYLYVLWYNDSGWANFLWLL